MLLDVTMNMTESQHDLNVRYANALLPLTVTFGVFAIVGVIGNVFVLLVFALGRDYRKSNFRVFVICMGIIDLLTSAFLIPAEMIKHRSYFAFESLIMCKTKCFFNVWAGNAAALSLLVICVDRFIKVVLPFKKQISPQLAFRLCIVLSFVVPVILSIPGAVMCGVLPSNKTNLYNTTTEVNVCATEPRYEKSILRYIYKYTFIILLLGISIACIVMYIMIGRQIFKHWGSIPASFRKDSCRDYNSDASSDTFGQLHVHPTVVDRKMEMSVSSNSDSQPSSQALLNRTDSDASKKIRPPLVHQGSSVDMDTHKSKKKLIKQLSSSSFGRKNRSASDSLPRRRTFSRQASGFGMRRFPYKTIIWFILTMVFIITYLLYLVLAVYVARFYNKSPESFAVFSFFFRLYFINNIINPIVYALLDKKFRKASRDIIPTLKARCRRNY